MCTGLSYGSPGVSMSGTVYLWTSKYYVKVKELQSSSAKDSWRSLL